MRILNKKWCVCDVSPCLLIQKHQNIRFDLKSMDKHGKEWKTYNKIKPNGIVLLFLCSSNFNARFFFCLRCESIPFISIFARAYKLMPTDENRWCCTKMMVCDEQQCQSGSSHSVRSTRDATKISILHKCNKKKIRKPSEKKPCLFFAFCYYLLIRFLVGWNS